MTSVIYDDRSAHAIYGDSVRYWHELQEFFNVAPSVKEPPTLLVCGPSEFDISCMPAESYRAEQDAVLKIALSRPVSSFYCSNPRMIVYDRRSPRRALVEEVTHDLVSVECPRVSLRPHDCAQFDAGIRDFGPQFEQTFRMFKDRKEWMADTCEFFPPIAQGKYFSLDVARERSQWNSNLHSLEYLLTGDLVIFWTGDDTAVYQWADSFVQHLPQLSGHLMVEQYKGDVKALLREHPVLPRLDGPTLWRDYCEPLLRTGRLP